jgi:hypothetical protein
LRPNRAYPIAERGLTVIRVGCAEHLIGGRQNRDTCATQDRYAKRAAQNRFHAECNDKKVELRLCELLVDRTMRRNERPVRA